jgi:hypothetical protein
MYLSEQKRISCDCFYCSYASSYFLRSDWGELYHRISTLRSNYEAANLVDLRMKQELGDVYLKRQIVAEMLEIITTAILPFYNALCEVHREYQPILSEWTNAIRFVCK